MRTKTLLLTAAVVAAGLAASVAQSVYSVNSVGYVNVTCTLGYNLIANPLNASNNNNQVNVVIPAAALPDDTTILTWNNGIQDFDQAIFVSGGTWVEQDFSPSSRVLNPGRAFFLQNQSGGNIPLTFVGDVPQGNLTNTIGANYDFVSSIVPQSASLPSMGFPGVQDMNYQTFDVLIQDYSQALIFDSGIWVDQAFTPTDPVPAVAQGFLITNPPGSPAQSWGRTFSVN